MIKKSPLQSNTGRSYQPSGVRLECVRFLRLPNDHQQGERTGRRGRREKGCGKSTALTRNLLTSTWGVSLKKTQGSSHQPSCCHSAAFPHRPHVSLVSTQTADGQRESPRGRERTEREERRRHLRAVVPVRSYKRDPVNLSALGRCGDPAPAVPNSRLFV